LEVSGGRGNGDVVAEAAQRGDVASGLDGGVASIEVVGAEFVVGDVVGQDMPDDDDHRVRNGEDGLAFVLLAHPP